MTASARVVALTDPLMSKSQPGRWWTSANTAEAMQGVLRPLDFSYQSHGIELGGRRAWHDFGVLRRRQVYLPTDPNDSFMGAFYGRIGINVNFAASMMDQVPGVSGKDLEMALLGYARPEARYTGAPWHRRPFIARGNREVSRTQGARLAAAEPEMRAWWHREVDRLSRATTGGRDALISASARFDDAMYLHLRTRFLLIMAQGRLAQALMAVDMVQHMQALTSAVGTAESDVADDLWRLAHGAMTTAAFLDRHGYHGPNEGSLSSRSWREDPRPIEHSAHALSGLDDADSPASRRARTAAERDELLTEFARRAPDGAAATEMVRFAQRVTAWTEQGKLLTLLALDVGRAAARVWGRDIVAAGLLDDPDDVYYFTVEEIRVGLPANAKELVAFRRAKRDEYLGYDIPITWSDDPEPIRIDALAGPAAVGTTLQGIGGHHGVVDGIARVVHDPASEAMEPGDVLVCECTDPSWLSLMALASALVVDIGGPTSHGAIVAREFGLPCVMGSGSGTRDIADGDRVRVDGASGTVTILDRTNGTSPSREEH